MLLFVLITGVQGVESPGVVVIDFDWADIIIPAGATGMSSIG